jgi:hypothetical protein
VPPPGPHDRILSEAAKVALEPVGFRRKGKSRLWIADHRWWLSVVEFQPSAWSKGAYLNVAAHWLWSDFEHVSFDFGGRVHEFVEYKDDIQFARDAAQLVDRAVAEAHQLRDRISGLESVAGDQGLERAAGHMHWRRYHAGVASALLGRRTAASQYFASIIDDPVATGSAVHAAALRIVSRLQNLDVLRDEIGARIQQHRAELKLEALQQAPL